MTDKITMEGEWAYSVDPTTRVRILEIDAEGVFPVTARLGVKVTTHTSRGSFFADGRSDRYDLVPLQREPRRIWANYYADGVCFMHGNKDAALISAEMDDATEIAVEFVEVRDE